MNRRYLGLAHFRLEKHDLVAANVFDRDCRLTLYNLTTLYHCKRFISLLCAKCGGHVIRFPS
jgi:hypothetical protein